MARYLLNSPAYLGADLGFVQADARIPAILNLADDFAPSRTWQPMDKAAQDAIFKLSGVRKPIVGAPEPAKERKEADTMAAVAFRVSDRSPV